MDNSFRLVIGNQLLPLDIHAVAADSTGHLLEIDWEGPVRFRFDHMGWGIAACMTEGPDLRLDLTADLGAMPFTAEARSERAGLQAIVDAANAHLGRVFQVTSERRIRLTVGGTIDQPVTAITLISAVVRHLVRVTPYLELFAVFLNPTGGARPAWRRGRG